MTTLLIHAASDLRAHPSRAVLSGLSLYVGVLALVAVFTVGTVTSEVFVASSEQKFGRRTSVSVEIAVPDPTSDVVPSLLEAAGLLHIPGGGVAITREPDALTGIQHSDSIRSGAQFERHQVVYVAGALDDVRRLPVLEGRWLESSRDLPVELVLNMPAAEIWGALGTRLDVLNSPTSRSVSGVVVGVVADGGPDPVVYASLRGSAALHPDILGTGVVRLLMHGSGTSMADYGALADAIASTAGVDVVPHSLSRLDRTDELLANLRTQQRAFLGIAALTLVVSALGILNIGLASISERARELVVRRAVGATRFDVVAQVVLSSVVIGMISAVCALATAATALASWLPTQIPSETAIVPPGVPWSAAGWGVAAAALTTVVGAAVPAALAGRLDVANALRD